MRFAGISVEGRIKSFNGVVARAKLWPVQLYQLVEGIDNRSIRFIVTGFERDLAVLMPIAGAEKISSALRIKSINQVLSVEITNDVVVPVFSSRMDDEMVETIPLLEDVTDAFNRLPVREQFKTGIKAIDWLMPVGVGQRCVIIANAGVGKSTLLRYILKHADYDIACVGLIGERRREVVEFLEYVREEGLEGRMKVVASPSDSSPLVRFLSSHTVNRLARYYCSRGKKVLLLLDSLTRVARSIREIGLQNGELPVKQGLTPSVFMTLPQIVEQPGNFEIGSITAFYTLLTNENHDSDYLAEEVKSLVDGHIILDRNLSDKGIFPAINIVSSLSRTWERFLTPEQVKTICDIRSMLKTLERDRDLLYLSDRPQPHLAVASQVERLVHLYLNQGIGDSPTENERYEFFLKVQETLHGLEGTRNRRSACDDQLACDTSKINRGGLQIPTKQMLPVQASR